MERKEFERTAPALRTRIVGMVVRVFGAEGAEIADDVAQDTLLRLWCMRDKLSTVANPDGLAMVMARNRAIDLLRENSRIPLDSLDGVEATDHSLTPYEQLTAAEDARRMDSILASLPSTPQAVLRMRHVEGMEIAEIAAVTGTTPGNIRVILSRARNQVKDLFLNS